MSLVWPVTPGTSDRLRRANRECAAAGGFSMSRRFYGGDHRRLRAEWLPQVNFGGVVCPRCGRFIQSGGEPCTKCGKPTRSSGFASDGYCGWDLGHLDGGADTDYTGPEHACCNRATTAHRKQRRQQRRNGNRVSRRWL